MTKRTATVEIKDDAGRWFVAHNGARLDLAKADAMVADLRAQGFKARAQLDA